MLSRISSFSGPFSKLFNIQKGFTLNGLILRYELKQVDSYTGSNSITDLVGNSNATLINGPTYSKNGYINLDGVNDYVMTDTSLNSALLPPDTSNIISYFLWVYPTDDGVIVTEQGNTTLNLSWHDSQIEIFSGSLKFQLWEDILIDSSIPISLYRWYYLGITYDGLNMKAFVNGQLAGTTTGNRLTPYNNGGNRGLFYGIGATDPTNLGIPINSGGSYAKMKFGAFHVYNTALTNQQVVNNYNSTKSNYIHTDDLVIWIDANDPQSYSGTGSSVYDVSGNYFTHSMLASSSWTKFNDINCFDCNTGYLQVNGIGPTLSTSGYTYVAWARIVATSSIWRTLFRTAPNDHPILTEVGTNNLGFYDNDTNNFKDSGYDVTGIVEKWVQYSVVGDSTSSIFYINDQQVGSVAFGAGGNRHDYFGGITGQPFGHIGNMLLYNSKLSASQIKRNYDALKHVYTETLVTSGLLLRLDANSTNSYSGSGTTWYDLADTQQNMTLINNPNFVSGSISYFEFNGTNQWMTGTGVTIPSTAYTKSIWFWINTYTDNNLISGFDGVGGHFIFMAGLTKLSFGHSNQGVGFTFYKSIGSINLNTWYNATLTFNTIDGMKIYINGVLDSTHAMTTAHNGNGSANLGSYLNSGSNFLNGRISKVYTYNRSLTSDEVLRNYNVDKSTFGY